MHPVRVVHNTPHCVLYAFAHPAYRHRNRVVDKPHCVLCAFADLHIGSFQPFLVYFLVAFGIASVFTVAPFFIAPARVDLDKSSAYECGFDAFGDSRQQFSVSFYLVAIMYLLFDIEVCAFGGVGVRIRMYLESEFLTLMPRACYSTLKCMCVNVHGWE